MAKRENNYSRTDERNDFKNPENIDINLEYLERTGKLKSKMVLPPKCISPKCIEYYNTIIQINNILDYSKLVINIPEFNLVEALITDTTSSAINIENLNKFFLEVADNETLVSTLKIIKTDLQTKVINLSSIVIGSVIKKFPTLYPIYYEDVFTACAVDILDKINKDKYDKTKSAFHSYMYESSYQACIKYIAEKVKYENSVVQLLQD